MGHLKEHHLLGRLRCHIFAIRQCYLENVNEYKFMKSWTQLTKKVVVYNGDRATIKLNDGGRWVFDCW